MPTILFETKGPRQRKSELDGDRFAFQIAGNHPEIEVVHIQTTIEEPDIITHDSNFENGENYYALGAISKWPAMFVKVCVRYEDNVGRVVTAFATDRPKASELVIWPLSDNSKR